jgi:dihydrofolate reductase
MRVIAIAAITADGKIARNAHQPVGWSSREDKQMFAQVSRAAGVVIMGRSTFEAMPAPLSGRLNLVLTSHPERFTPVPGLVEYASGTPQAVLGALAKRGQPEVIVGGGSTVYRAFLASGLVDELWLTVEPLLFGSGISLLDRAIPDLHLHLLELVRLNADSIQLKYAVLPPAGHSAGPATTRNQSSQVRTNLTPRPPSLGGKGEPGGAADGRGGRSGQALPTSRWTHYEPGARP